MSPLFLRYRLQGRHPPCFNINSFFKCLHYIIRPTLHQKPNFLCKHTMKTKVSCGLWFLVTQRAVWITQSSPLDKFVYGENFRMNQKSGKELVLPLSMCFLDVAGLEIAIETIKLCQIGGLGRIEAISCPPPRELIFLIIQRNLLHQISKYHKLDHLFDRTHTPQPPNPGLILQLFPYFLVISPS